jgi:hypothetical protein
VHAICYFCGASDTSDSSNLLVPMVRIRQVKREDIWDDTKVTVPRCKRCKRAHSAVRVVRKLFWVAAIFAGFAIVVTGVFSPWVPNIGGWTIIPIKPTGLFVLFGLFCLPVLGVPLLIGGLGHMITGSLFHKKTRSQSTKHQFPEVQTLKAKGWKMDEW